MTFDKQIHAAGEGFQIRSLLTVKQSNIAIRGAGQTQAAEISINFQCRRANNFGEPAGSAAPNQIHLPKAILRHDVTLRREEVLGGLRADMRNAECVAEDGHFVFQPSQFLRAVNLRQRTVDDPIAKRAEAGNENYYREQDVNEYSAHVYWNSSMICPKRYIRGVGANAV
jgi:hypothetical protein